MIIRDPGHRYQLQHFDGNSPVFLQFVKRNSPPEKYPGNLGRAYCGTTTQEVLRALIDRTKYVDEQKPFVENQAVLKCLRDALFHLELRAAGVRGYSLPWDLDIDRIEDYPTCLDCGHICCTYHPVRG